MKQVRKQIQRQAYDLHGLKVLIIEESAFMAELMRSILREFGVAQAISTCSLDKAKETLEEHNNDSADKMSHIDLLIIDLLHPEQSGLSFLSWVRTHEWNTIKYLPTLFCSTHICKNVVFEGRDRGTNEVLVKPLSAEKLAQRLSYIIEHPRPFVKSKHYFGPERRRKSLFFDTQERRRTDMSKVKVSYEAG